MQDGPLRYSHVGCVDFSAGIPCNRYAGRMCIPM